MKLPDLLNRFLRSISIAPAPKTRRRQYSPCYYETLEVRAMLDSGGANGWLSLAAGPVDEGGVAVVTVKWEASTIRRAILRWAPKAPPPKSASTISQTSPFPDKWPDRGK